MSDLLQNLTELLAIPGLSGHEDRVRRAIAAKLDALGITSHSDRLGNLIATLPGDDPQVMLFAHMDQLGFILRKIEPDGFLRLERLGGVPERALPAQEVVISTPDGRDIPGIIANKSHHATKPDEKYTVLKTEELYVDCGFASADEALAAGLNIGAPVVYAPGSFRIGEHRLTGPAIDDRAACAVMIDLAARLITRETGPTVHLVFSVQEEFNLRGAQVAAQTLLPDIAIQLDLMLATDTPDMADRGEMRLGHGPGMSLYSFHGRGTLNGVLPHPALVKLIETTAAQENIPLQRSAQTGILTDLSYVQLVGEGVASIDLGFPMRYSHSAREVCDLRDLHALTNLLDAALARIKPDFNLNRD